jgi:lipopolysaccharide export system permease protein
MARSRGFTRIWGYVGREFLLAFAVAFLFFFFIFFVNQVLVMAEDIFSRRVAVWDVLRLVAYSLPWVVALSFPFGSLVGALMAVGRMASDNETLALGALGIPHRQLLVPLLTLGLAFSAVSFVMNDYFLPLGNIRFAELWRRIITTNPAVELEPHSIRKVEDTTIVTGAVEGNTIHDLVIFDRTTDRARRMIVARSARLEEQTRGVVSLVLTDVFSETSVPREGDRYDYTTAKSMVYNIALKNISVSLGALSPAQQSSVDVWRQIAAKEQGQQQRLAQRDARAAALGLDLAAAFRAAREAAAAGASPAASQRAQAAAEGERAYAQEAARDVTDHNLRSYLLEFHWKFSVPAACLAFAFFAWPVGLMARRSGRAVGFGVGLFVAIAYWGLLFAGRTFGVRLSTPPALSMWLPDALVTAAGFVVLAARRRLACGASTACSSWSTSSVPSGATWLLTSGWRPSAGSPCCTSPGASRGRCRWRSCSRSPTPSG